MGGSAESGVYLKDCADSWFGCCPDGKTPAQGPENDGCPSMCGCNKIGKNIDSSVSFNCSFYCNKVIRIEKFRLC